MLRKLTKNDVQGILAIEESVQISPWNEETFHTCFQSGYLGWVIELNHDIIGFIIVSLRMAECHVLNLCMALPYHHMGYGRKLMEHSLSYAKQNGFAIAYLEVRRSNTKAIALYEKMQFRIVGERKDYYPASQGKEDALIFAKSLCEEIR